MANIWSVYRVPFVVPFDLGAAFRYVGHRYADNANAVRLNAYLTTDAWVSVPYKNMTFMLRGDKVDYSGTVLFKDGTESQLADGVQVEVKGVLSDDRSTLKALVIEFER